MKKILLTGATGYIGKRMISVITEQGYKVVCCSRDVSRFSKPSGIKDDLIEVIFAETFLWSDMPYCINAEAVIDTIIIKVLKDDFLNMIDQNKDLMQNLLKHNAERMFYRHKMLATLSINNPSHRIYKVLQFLKDYHQIIEPFKFLVPFSRQQIANLTGLLVETVIRNVKKLEQEDLVRISEGRIYL